jgi:uncharacterized protein YceK
MSIAKSPVRQLILRVRHHLLSILLLYIVISLSACSSIKVHATNHDILHPYLGTERAIQGFYDSFSDYVIYNQATLMAIDIPMCLVADTLVLPYDLVVWLNRRTDRD